MKYAPFSILSRGERALAAALGTTMGLAVVSLTLAGFVVSTSDPDMPLVRVEPIVLSATKPT